MSEHIYEARLLTDAAVASTGTATSSGLHLNLTDSLDSLVVKASSASGTADVKVEYSTSPDNTNYDSFDDNEDLVTSTLLQFPNNPEGYNVLPMPNHRNLYLKVKVTGIASNPADTVVTVIAMCRECI